MDQLTQLVSSINSILWGPFCLIPLLVGVGIYFTLKLRGVQIRHFCKAVSFVFGGVKIFGQKADKEGMSSFQSLATAIAAQVGTGNLAGVATAIALGGPGAIFWMWLAAFFGMATIFVEAVLAQIYKVRGKDGHITGGPAYYITQGLGNKPLAYFFSFSIIVALGFIGNMVQSNSISEAFQAAFGVPYYVIGLVVVLLAGFVFFGGVRRLASTTEKIVPFMAFIYVIGGLFVIFSNADQIIPAFKMIFVGAFNPEAATGGVIGASIKEAIRYGVARGLFSNEAGMGSTPHAHAMAKVKDPIHQGLVAMVGVFIDTFIVLNITAFVIFTTGAIDGQTSGIALTQKAFTSTLGGVGMVFVAICLFFFAFSTILGWCFFGEQNVKFLFGVRWVNMYRMIVLCFLALGSYLQVNLVWELADLFNGLMVLPNLVALVALAKVVDKALANFDAGLPPEELHASVPKKYSLD